MADAGPLGRVLPIWEGFEWAHDLSADLWVWRVFLVRGDRGADVFIDFVDGLVHGVIQTIVN